MFVEHSSTNTSRLASILSATITRQAALSHSSRSAAPTDLFFDSTPETLYCPGDRRVANSHSRRALQELPPLRKGGGRTLLEVRLKEPLASLIDLRAQQAGTLLRSQWPPLVCHTDVTLETEREAHAEGSRHLTFTHPPLYSLDDPLTQVFGVRFHLSIVSCGSVALQLALGFIHSTVEKRNSRKFNATSSAPLVAAGTARVRELTTKLRRHEAPLVALRVQR